MRRSFPRVTRHVKHLRAGRRAISCAPSGPAAPAHPRITNRLVVMIEQLDRPRALAATTTGGPAPPQTCKVAHFSASSTSRSYARTITRNGRFRPDGRQPRCREVATLKSSHGPLPVRLCSRAASPIPFTEPVRAGPFAASLVVKNGSTTATSPASPQVPVS